jgi:hypothetical protein
VTAHLQPDGDRAVLAIALQGTSHSDTVGYQEYAKVYTHTILNFQVHQLINIDDKGVRLFTPLAWANARVYWVAATNARGDPASLISGQARYQFCEDWQQIEAVTSKKGEIRTAASFSRELKPKIDSATRGLNTTLNALADLGVPMQPMRWNTTLTHLHGEVGRVTQPPLTGAPDLPATTDLTMRVHQSVLHNIAQKKLAGKTFSPLDLITLRETIFSILNSDPSVSDPKLDPKKLGSLLELLRVEPVSITFSKSAPVAVDLNADGFTITLHGSSFRQGGAHFPARSIRGRYRIEFGPKDEAVLVREGSVQVLEMASYPDLDEARNQKVRKLLEQSFNFFLPDRLELPRITIPGDRPIVLSPTHAATSPGWLTLGWKIRN